MNKSFYVHWLNYKRKVNGYGAACQKCAELIKDGHKPKIVIEYEDAYDEKVDKI